MAIAPTRPDWRWVRVVELSEYVDSQVLPRLKGEDEGVKRLFKFKRAFDRGFGFEDSAHLSAHSLFHECFHQRLILESLIVAGGTNEDIKEFIEIDDEDIDAYVSAFFDIRGRKPGTVCSMLFQGFPHKGTHPSDTLGLAHRVAWLCKLDVVKEMLSSGGLSDVNILAMRKMVNDTLMKNTAEIALTAASRGDLAHEFVKLTLDVGKDDKDEAGSSADDYVKAIENFTAGIGLTVAQPKTSATLEQPIKEAQVIGITNDT